MQRGSPVFRWSLLRPRSEERVADDWVKEETFDGLGEEVTFPGNTLPWPIAPPHRPALWAHAVAATAGADMPIRGLVTPMGGMAPLVSAAVRPAHM